MAACYSSILITANIVSLILFCTFLLISKSIIQNTSRKCGAGIIKSWEGTCAKSGTHGGKEIVFTSEVSYWQDSPIPMPPTPGVSLELLYTQMSYLSGFTPETNIQPASGANMLIRCTGFKSHAVLRGRLQWRWGSGSGANVSGKKWCHGFSVSSYFTGLAQGQTSFVWRYGGGIGGGIMTAESISASRAAVRSKSQHGENMKGGKLLRRSGLAQPCALT